MIAPPQVTQLMHDHFAIRAAQPMKCVAQGRSERHPAVETVSAAPGLCRCRARYGKLIRVTPVRVRTYSGPSLAAIKSTGDPVRVAKAYAALLRKRSIRPMNFRA